MERRGVADLLGDLGEGLVGVGEELAGLREALGLKIAAGRLADLAAKERREAGAREAKTARGRFERMALVKVLGEMIDRLLDTRMPTRGSSAGGGAMAVEYRTLEGIQGEIFSSGHRGVEGGSGEDKFLADGGAEFGRKAEMAQAGTEFGPVEPFERVGAGDPMDPDVTPAPGGMVLAVILRRAGLEKDDVAGISGEFAAGEANEAMADFRVEEQPVLAALRPPAVDVAAGIPVLRMERTGGRRRGYLHETILYVFG